MKEDKKREFAFYIKEENALGENVSFGIEKMTLREAKEYAKEYKLIFEEIN